MKLVPALKLVPAMKFSRFDIGKHFDVGFRIEIGSGFEVCTHVEDNISFISGTSINEIKVGSSLGFIPTLSLVPDITIKAMLTFLPSIASQEGNSVLVFVSKVNIPNFSPLPCLEVA